MYAISIIIPIYNTANYLSRCVESVLAQDIDVDFELILVDDGSTDNSGALCDSYACRYSNIRVIHQPNGGVASARNVGIDTSKGDYICFVDSDDELPATSLSDLWKEVSLHPDVDVVCGQIEIDGKNISNRETVPDFTSDRRTIRSFNLWQLLGFSACARLVSRQLIKDFNIKFIPGISYGEDPLWIFFLHKHIRSVSQCRRVVYRYNTDNTGSAMHWRDLTNAYSSAMKCVVMACNNFDMAARAIEKQYILDLLSIKRYNNAVANGNNTVIRNIVNGMYDAINQVVTHPPRTTFSSDKIRAKIKLPFAVRFAAWRLTLGHKWANNFVINLFSRLCRL